MVADQGDPQPLRQLALAVGISLLLHAWWLSMAQPQYATISPMPTRLSVVLRKQASPPPSPAPTHADRLPAPAHRPFGRARPTTSGVAESPALPPPKMTPVPTTAEAVPDEFTASASLREHALAGVHEADRQTRDAAARGPWMVKPKALPPSLAGLPKEAQTALQRRFDDRLAELVIISQVERQEGNYRVTIIETNKGRLCGYEPLVKKSFMVGQATVEQWGTCGPKS
jgi:hypothetical protein